MKIIVQTLTIATITLTEKETIFVLKCPIGKLTKKEKLQNSYELHAGINTFLYLFIILIFSIFLVPEYLLNITAA